MASLSNKSSLPPAVTALLVPLFMLAIIIVLFVVAFKVGSSRINVQRGQLKTAEQGETVLEQKQEVLQEVQGKVVSYADTTNIAMPEENPALMIISQLKKLAGTNSVALADIKIGAQTKGKESFSKAIVSFEIEGEFKRVLSYLTAIGDFAPLSTVDQVEVTQVGGAVRATVSLAFFWAPSPEKLPPISEPIHGLTAEEIELIAQLASLKQPAFVEISAQSPVTRGDPFSF